VTAASRPPGRSPFRVLLSFVVALGVVLLVAGAVAVALTPPAPPPDCPDPNQVCGRPPEEPTLPPASQVAGASPSASVPGVPLPTEAPSATAAPTDAPTAAPTDAPTAAPTDAPTAAPTPEPTAAPTEAPTVAPSAPASPEPTTAPTPEPTTPPTVEPSAPPSVEPSAPASEAPSASPSAGPSPTPGTGFVVPLPRPASDAAPYRAGTVWRSSAWGFSFEFDDDTWTISEESANGVQLRAGRGNVSLSIGAFPAGDRSPQQVFEDEKARLADVILGFTPEPDPFLALPGIPNIGYRVGFGGAFAGTINSPQGPTVNVSIAILTAGDDQKTVLVSLVTVSQLRPPAFSVSDSILNTFRWNDPED
jgi:hypothetical protein